MRKESVSFVDLGRGVQISMSCGPFGLHLPEARIWFCLMPS
jgi:hypothetical protein